VCLAPLPVAHYKLRNVNLEDALIHIAHNDFFPEDLLVMSINKSTWLDEGLWFYLIDRRHLIHRAVVNSSVASLLFLLKKGADVNVVDSAGHTALITAAVYEDAECAAVLVEAGADVNAKQSDGYNALGLASTAAVRSLLIQAGAEEILFEGDPNEGV
jgi:hypothetical protein